MAVIGGAGHFVGRGAGCDADHATETVSARHLAEAAGRDGQLRGRRLRRLDAVWCCSAFPMACGRRLPNGAHAYGSPSGRRFARRCRLPGPINPTAVPLPLTRWRRRRKIVAISCCRRTTSRDALGACWPTIGSSVDVHAGEIHALIGPNGAGKSTFFNMISGVDTPSEGRVELRGESMAGRPSRDFAQRGLARTFQHVRLLGQRSVIDNVALGAHLRGQRGWIASMLRLDRREEARLRQDAFAPDRSLRTRSLMPTPPPARCRWASSASSRSRAHWLGTRTCCCWMSRPPVCVTSKNAHWQACWRSYAKRTSRS